MCEYPPKLEQQYPPFLNAEGMLDYLRMLNDSARLRYGDVGTICDLARIRDVVADWGNFVLTRIPTALLPQMQSPTDRLQSVSGLFDSNCPVPPVVVSEVYKDRAGNRKPCLFLLDGHTRAHVASVRGLDILGYIPEKLLAALPEVVRI